MNREIEKIQKAIAAFNSDPTDQNSEALKICLVIADQKIDELKVEIDNLEDELEEAEELKGFSRDEMDEAEEEAKEELLSELNIKKETLHDELKLEITARLLKNYSLQELEAIELLGKEKFPKFNYKEAYQS